MEVTLRVKYAETKWGEYVAVVGDHPCLGNWENAVALVPDHFPVWSTVIRLPANNNNNYMSISKITYKFVLCGPDASILLWEPIPSNRSLIIDNDSITCETSFGSLPSNISRSYVAPVSDFEGEVDPENDVKSVQSDQSPPDNAQSAEFTPTPTSKNGDHENITNAGKEHQDLVRYTSPCGIMDNDFQSEEENEEQKEEEREEGQEETLETVSDGEEVAPRRNLSSHFEDDANSSQSGSKKGEEPAISTSTSDRRVQRKLVFDFVDGALTPNSHSHSPRGVMDDDRSSVVSESDIESKRRSNSDLLINSLHKAVDTDLAHVGCALEETLAMAAVARKKIRSMIAYASPSSSCNSTPLKSFNGDEHEHTAANTNGRARTLDEELKDAVVNAHEARRLLQEACEQIRELHVTPPSWRRRRRRSASN